MLLRARSPYRRILALTVAIVLALGALAPRAAAHEHCAAPAQAHEGMPAMHHAGHGQAPMPASSVSKAPHGCDHCPPEQCAAAEACAGTALALHARVTALTAHLPRRAVTSAPWTPAASRSTDPPTPPPTTLL